MKNNLINKNIQKMQKTYIGILHSNRNEVYMQ